jgi:hypothetical protein
MPGRIISIGNARTGRFSTRHKMSRFCSEVRKSADSIANTSKDGRTVTRLNVGSF